MRFLRRAEISDISKFHRRAEISDIRKFHRRAEVSGASSTHWVETLEHPLPESVGQVEPHFDEEQCPYFHPR